MRAKRILCGTMAMLLAACTTERGVVEQPPPPSPAAPTSPLAPPPAPEIPGQPPGEAPGLIPAPPPQNFPRTIDDLEPPAPAPVLYLVRQANSARAAGHADQSESYLERALRIESRNPFVWQALAGARLDLGRPDEAESAAQKATSLARGNPYVEAGDWRLIAAARHARGDADGARQAQSYADDVARALNPAP